MTVDSDATQFTMVRRGYDRTQVDEALAGLRTDLETAVAARAATGEQVRDLTQQLEASRREAQAAKTTSGQVTAELDRLRSQVAELATVPTTVDGMSERLQQMVLMAQDEVNDMRARATQRAQKLITLASAEAAELRERAAGENQRFEVERQQAIADLQAQQEESQARLKQLSAESDGLRAQLDAELSERRARLEEQLSSELAERRKVVLDKLEAQEDRQRQEASRILDAAQQQARQRLAEASAEAERVRVDAHSDVDTARRELGELRSLQHQIAEQLTSIRALLDWTLPQVVPPAEPADGGAPADDPAPAGTDDQPRASVPPSPVTRNTAKQAPTPAAGAGRP